MRRLKSATNGCMVFFGLYLYNNYKIKQYKIQYDFPVEEQNLRINRFKKVVCKTKVNNLSEAEFLHSIKALVELNDTYFKIVNDAYFQFKSAEMDFKVHPLDPYYADLMMCAKINLVKVCMKFVVEPDKELKLN